MLKYLGICLVMIVTSFFFFPVTFVWFPAMNTKTTMAAVGLVILLVQLARRRMPVLDSGLLMIAVWAAGVSFMSFFAITYNGTNDSSYLTYFISMCVWLSAAYLATTAMRCVHGTLTLKVVANYLIAVCTLQCLLAFAIDQIPLVENVVNSIFITDVEGMAKGRLYGIGAAFDVAGLRFMAVLAITAYMMVELTEQESKKYLKWYIVSFLIISLLGNMISRTSIFGVVIGLLYLVWATIFGKVGKKSNLVRLWRYLALSMGALVLCSVFLYQTNQSFRNNMQYGFEGFFSLYEKGKWEVSSNRGLVWMLKNIKPETTRTWIIGDGYCDDPNEDPYYTGSQLPGGYYMGTDVGYMRFIFYFGVLGTLVFMVYFCQVAYVCAKHFPRYRNMFLLVLLCNFIGWIKVSTDVFVVFSLFLAIILSGYSEEIGFSQKRIET